MENNLTLDERMMILLYSPGTKPGLVDFIEKLYILSIDEQNCRNTHRCPYCANK